MGNSLAMEKKDGKTPTLNSSESVEEVTGELEKDAPQQHESHKTRGLQLDRGQEHLIFRRKWWQLW